MASPKISIVTISYNQGSFLKECLSSVASQNFNDYEHIVVDDGSTDESREIILNFKDKVIPVFKENSGPADSLNAGFKIARGEIFGYINSDDYLLQNTLHDVDKLFNELRDFDVIYGNGYIVDINSHYTKKMISKKFSMLDYFYGRSIICQQATFFKKKAFFDVGGFNTENNSSWDFELFADMYKKKYKFKKVDNFLGAFRIYSGSMTGSKKYTKRNIQYKRLHEKYFQKKKNIMDVLKTKFFYLIDKILNPKKIILKIKDFYLSKKKIKIV
jgi:glycosyltransferase involved in cell wall biosynthesis